MQPALVRRIVEAALLASPQPLSLAQLGGLFPEEAPPPPGSLEQAVAELMEQNAQRGITLIEVASGFRFQVDSELQPWVSRLWAERPARYSRALLETLALIAYRQPITRGEIEQIRGVAVSSHIIKTLEEREWIRVLGHRDVPGRPALFGTTRGFLDYFGLKSLDQLPPLTELQDLPDLEPELPLEGIVQPAAGHLSQDPATAGAERTDGASDQANTDSPSAPGGSAATPQIAAPNRPATDADDAVAVAQDEATDPAPPTPAAPEAELPSPIDPQPEDETGPEHTA
jgi:segregation and condensation protein B